MKRYMMFITILLIFYGYLYAEVRENVYYREIKSIYFHAVKDLGASNSYAIFYDKDQNPCSTNGIIMLYRKRTILEGRTIDPYFEQKLVPVEKKELIKEITFNHNDFKYMKLLRGDTIFALPIIFDANEVQSEDILILEWCNLRAEKKIL